MKRICQFALLTTVLLPDVCQARLDQDNTFQSLGAGQVSCGEWTKNRAENSEPAYQMSSWVLGFITGYNLYGSGSNNVSKGTDLEGLNAWLDNYCAGHPLDPFGVAAQALIFELVKKAAP